MNNFSSFLQKIVAAAVVLAFLYVLFLLASFILPFILFAFLFFWISGMLKPYFQKLDLGRKCACKQKPASSQKKKPEIIDAEYEIIDGGE